MIVKNLKLTNFRNYNSVAVEFNSTVNYIVGKNAQGKTNLVEPLYILSTLKSFRNSKIPDCIMEDKQFAIIEAEIDSKIYGIKKIKYVLKKDDKNEYYVNENKLTKKSEMLCNMFSVIFSPDELKLIKGSPEVRREFLDTDISQVSKVYCSLIDRYNVILQHRNKLLKFSKNSSTIDKQLDVWDSQLAMVGSQITLTRQNFIAKITDYTTNIMNKLTNNKEELKLEYIGINGKTREEKTEIFLSELKASRQKDLELGYTTIGPHRDDVKFFINNKEVKPFASQGQQRTVVLAVKLAEMEVIKSEVEEPILILDDVFSELDNTRQKFLIDYLQDKQIFITSTTHKKLALRTYKKIKVNNANLKELNF